MGNARVYAEHAEVLTAGTGHARVLTEWVEVLLNAESVARVYAEHIEVLTQVPATASDQDVDSTLSLTQTVVFVHSIPLSASSTLHAHKFSNGESG
jgi:hypothetical protein